MPLMVVASFFIRAGARPPTQMLGLYRFIIDVFSRAIVDGKYPTLWNTANMVL